MEGVVPGNSRSPGDPGLAVHAIADNAHSPPGRLLHGWVTECLHLLVSNSTLGRGLLGNLPQLQKAP